MSTTQELGRVVINDKSALRGVLEDSGVVEVIRGRLGLDNVHFNTENIAEGFGSLVMYVEGQNAVVKIPKVGEHKPAAKMLQSLAVAGIPDLMGLWTVGDGGVEEVGFDKDGVVKKPDQILRMNENSVQYLFLLLKQFPVGDTLLNKMINREVGDDKLLDVYASAGRALNELHQQQTEPHNNINWNFLAASHVVLADERMRTILEMPQLDKEWFSRQQKRDLVRKMIKVSRMQLNQEQPNLVRMHGDNWEGNWWVGQDEQVTLFDPALAYGYRGHDVAFGIGKQLIRQLAIKGDVLSLNNLNAFIENYGEENWLKAQESMWNPLVFKMVVGAAFDGYSGEVNGQLIRFSGGLLDHKIANPEAVFSLELAREVWDKAY